MQQAVSKVSPCCLLHTSRTALTWIELRTPPGSGSLDCLLRVKVAAVHRHSALCDLYDVLVRRRQMFFWSCFVFGRCCFRHCFWHFLFQNCAVAFWEQNTQIVSALPPKRHCSSKRIKRVNPELHLRLYYSSWSVELDRFGVLLGFTPRTDQRNQIDQTDQIEQIDQIYRIKQTDQIDQTNQIPGTSYTKYIRYIRWIRWIRYIRCLADAALVIVFGIFSFRTAQSRFGKKLLKL